MLGGVRTDRREVYVLRAIATYFLVKNRLTIFLGVIKRSAWPLVSDNIQEATYGQQYSRNED